MKAKIIKKIICALLLVSALFINASCKKSLDLTVYVSQLRLGVYQGVSENFDLTLYSESKEKPFAIDGFVGEMGNVLIVKLNGTKTLSDGVKITVKYDDYECSGEFKLNPVNSTYTAEIEVENLPNTPNVLAFIETEEVKEQVSLVSKVSASKLDYKSVLKFVQDSDSETVKKLFTSNVSTEIHIRIIPEKGKNYYYVGFNNKDGSISAYLVDGETGEVLARRTN